MIQPQYKYIYGPVLSWRLGRSLGIDPISSVQKICTFDCVYCQVRRTEIFPKGREIFVPTEAILKELKSFPEVSLDYLTFAGNGEPTLAKNLGELIRAVQTVRKTKTAVITNASLIDRKDVQEDLLSADLVDAKLDACSEKSLDEINRPPQGIALEKIVEGLKAFRKIYPGRLVLQIMFMEANRTDAREMARLAAEISPDEIEINTPLRVSPTPALAPEAIEKITRIFHEICGDKIKVRNVYEAKRIKSNPLCRESTERRRGKENL